MPYIGRSSNFGVRTRFLYTATASQTTFSGTDTQNLTLSYSDSNFIDVHQNGVLLKVVDDYTATSGTSVVLATGATASDVIEITVYDVFSIANHIKKTGDAMAGALTNIDIDGTELVLDADGDTSITADTDDQIDFKTGGSDRVIIDSSGNLLVGQTSQATNATGFSARANSLSHFCRDTSSTGSGVLLLNKKTGNGHVLVIQKDDSTVGTVGVNGNDNIQIFSSAADHAGLEFATHLIAPLEAGSASDGTIDLGASSARYKDLYLSGGVYLGGTGAANYLDDYEEGTFTPTYGGLGGHPTVTYDVDYGHYTKVGRLVTFNLGLGTDAVSGGSGNVVINGLPFTISNNHYIRVVAYSWDGDNTVYNSKRPDIGYILNNSTQIRLWDASTSSLDVSDMNTTSNDNRVFITGFYYTT